MLTPTRMRIVLIALALLLAAAPASPKVQLARRLLRLVAGLSRA